MNKDFKTLKSKSTMKRTGFKGNQHRLAAAVTGKTVTLPKLSVKPKPYSYCSNNAVGRREERELAPVLPYLHFPELEEG